MTRTLALAGAAAAAFTLQSACGQSADKAQDTVAEASAESGVGSNQASNTVQDAASAAVGTVSASTLGANTVEGYVTNAAISDMYEIASGKLAQERSKNAEIKKFGQQLVTDHTKTSADLKAAVGQAGVQVTIPTEMDERRKGMVDNLRQASEADFDKVFIAQQNTAHSEALTLHRGFADNSDNAALKAVAAKAAPVVERHLQHAKGMGEGGAAKSGGAAH